MELLYTLLRVLFPDFCKKCKKYGTILCDNCILQLKTCDTAVEGYSFAAFSYKDPLVRSIILSLKTRNNTPVSLALARHMVEVCFEEIAHLSLTKNFKDPIVIPIPSSPDKKNLLGFNHAETLASQFCEINSSNNFVLKTNILFKRNNISKQATTKSRSDRFTNILQAFYTKNNEDILNSCVIIIDDVTTTGATFAAARQLILQAGARQVICVAIAH